MKKFLMFVGWIAFVVAMWKYVFIPVIKWVF
jgi:hypothetical protein